MQTRFRCHACWATTAATARRRLQKQSSSLPLLRPPFIQFAGACARFGTQVETEIRDRIHTMEQAAIRLPFLHDSAFVRGLMDHDNRPGEARDFSLDSVTDGLVFRYVVPEHVCAVDGLKANNEGSMPLSAVLAVFDNVSTWSLIGADRWNRPGVSLGLSLRRLSSASIRAGTVLEFRTRLGKVGQRIGFCDGDIVNTATNELVAVAQHTKFMDMGLGWRAVVPRLLATNARRTNLLRLLHWVPPNESRPKAHQSMAPEADFADLLKIRYLDEESRHSDTELPSPTVFTDRIVCNEAHYNPAGSVHGGCLAMLMEQVAWTSLEAGCRQSPPRELQHLQISYLTAAKHVLRGTGQVLGSPAELPNPGSPSTSSSAARSDIVSVDLREEAKNKKRSSGSPRFVPVTKGIFEFAHM